MAIQALNDSYTIHGDTAYLAQIRKTGEYVWIVSIFSEGDTHPGAFLKNPAGWNVVYKRKNGDLKVTRGSDLTCLDYQPRLQPHDSLEPDVLAML